MKTEETNKGILKIWEKYKNLSETEKYPLLYPELNENAEILFVGINPSFIEKMNKIEQDYAYSNKSFNKLKAIKFEKDNKEKPYQYFKPMKKIAEDLKVNWEHLDILLIRGETQRKVKFTSIKGHRKQVNNNAIENLHTHMKEMQKVRRGVTEVQDYADGFKVFHNFIKVCEKDKLTPAERCGIKTEGNRWQTLLLNSIKKEKATSLTGEEILIKSP